MIGPGCACDTPNAMDCCSEPVNLCNSHGPVADTARKILGYVCSSPGQDCNGAKWTDHGGQKGGGPGFGCRLGETCEYNTTANVAADGSIIYNFPYNFGLDNVCFRQQDAESCRNIMFDELLPQICTWSDDRCYLSEEAKGITNNPDLVVCPMHCSAATDCDANHECVGGSCLLKVSCTQGAGSEGCACVDIGDCASPWVCEQTSKTCRRLVP
jgi:hypothetical protein